MKNHSFGPYRYTMQYQGRAYRVEWEMQPPVGMKVRDPFSGGVRTVDGIDGAGFILATDETGYQGASAPWDLDVVDTDSEASKA